LLGGFRINFTFAEEGKGEKRHLSEKNKKKNTKKKKKTKQKKNSPRTTAETINQGGQELKGEKSLKSLSVQKNRI